MSERFCTYCDAEATVVIVWTDDDKDGDGEHVTPLCATCHSAFGLGQCVSPDECEEFDADDYDAENDDDDDDDDDDGEEEVAYAEGEDES